MQSSARGRTGEGLTMRTDTAYLYLYHGHGTKGPFRTEVTIKHSHADNYYARFEGLWRKVHIQVNRTFIIYRGEKITIQIEGL